MVDVSHKSAKLGVLGGGALAFGMVAATLGAGAASANPNDPGMTDVRGNGVVSSRQADSTSGAGHCVVNPGTLGTASVHSSDHGEPMQRAAETGPSWVGSDGWNASGLSPSNPWRGNFNQSTGTGPQCKKGRASKGNSF
ncbi:MAG: hypothetical protein K0U71_15700 [Actinomycetia bacterium]|nr:hypothetical protein [Actinomycetes bacterium]